MRVGGPGASRPRAPQGEGRPSRSCHGNAAAPRPWGSWPPCRPPALAGTPTTTTPGSGECAGGGRRGPGCQCPEEQRPQAPDLRCLQKALPSPSGLQRTQVEGPVTGASRCSHTTPTLSLPSGTWSAEGPGLEALLPPQVQASVSSPHGEWPAGPAPAHRTVSSAPRRALGSCPCTALERVMSSQYWLLPKQGPCVK